MKVKEFKMWLEGVLAFQEDKVNWKPTAKQWKTILEKIMELEDSPEIVRHHGQQQPVQPHQQPQPRPILQQPGEGLAEEVNNPDYVVHSAQDLEIMKQKASEGGIFAVPIKEGASTFI